MPVNTRSSDMDDNTKELIKEVVNASLNEFTLSMQDMHKNFSDLSETMNGALLHQRVTHE